MRLSKGHFLVPLVETRLHGLDAFSGRPHRSLLRLLRGAYYHGQGTVELGLVAK
jgi:hypothetical protein